MSNGLLSRVKQLEEQVRRLRGLFQGPPWNRIVLANAGETSEQAFDRLGLEGWERSSTLAVVLDDTPQVDAAPAQGTAGER